MLNMIIFSYYEWLVYKEHEELNTLMDWKPTWIPIIAFPELVHQWKLHFAESPNAGQFSIGILREKKKELDMVSLIVPFALIIT